MRGIGKTLSRLPAARAWIAGAAILAGAAASVAHAQSTGSGNGDETAMAIPRLASPGDVSGVALPQPLAPSDAARVRRIFALQSRGNMAEAAEETSQLTDPTLLGPILANRYLGRFHRATPDELIVWLERHADEPDAPAIYALLTRRAPKGMVIPPLPNADRVTEAATPAPAPEDADPRDRTIARNPLLDRTVAARAASGNDRSALRLIAMTKGLSASYTALLRGEVAQALFTQNRDDDALEVASSAIHHTPDDEQVGLPGYIAGLAAWRMERMNLALSSFERAWRAPVAPSAMRAAAAFWAARASLHTRDIPGYVMWMKRASVEPRTFYGLLARQALGLGFGFQGIRETLAEADVNALAATSEGVRAFALLQVGEQDRAEAELRQLWSRAKDDSSLMRSVLLVASQAGLIDLAAQLADVVQTADGRPRDNLRFPVPRLNPRGGFQGRPGADLRACPRRVEFQRLRRLSGGRARTDADHASHGRLHRERSIRCAAFARPGAQSRSRTAIRRLSGRPRRDRRRSDPGVSELQCWPRQFRALERRHSRRRRSAAVHRGDPDHGDAQFRSARSCLYVDLRGAPASARTEFWRRWPPVHFPGSQFWTGPRPSRRSPRGCTDLLGVSPADARDSQFRFQGEILTEGITDCEASVDYAAVLHILG